MRRLMEAPYLPLLVTGVAGVAGYNAFRYFRSRHGDRVLGTRRRDNWPLAGDGIVACDADDRDELRRLFDRHSFRAVLHAEGSCKLKSCELDPAMARRVNVTSVERMLDRVAGTDVRLLHLSIDLVFSGTRGGNHVEHDATDPVTVYGATMVEAERLVLERKPDACVLRISLPMGVSFNGHAGAIDWIQSRFKKSKPATLYVDEIRSPTYTDCLNGLFDVLLASDLAGLYHAGGPRKLSLYQIAQIVNRVGGYDPRLLIGCPRISAGPIPPRAGDVTLNSGKLIAALGYDPFDPWPVWDQFAPGGTDWHFHRPPGEEGSPRLLRDILYRNPVVKPRNRSARSGEATLRSLPPRANGT
jgi:dTDP-4-dehydrorhamnose reductase